MKIGYVRVSTEQQNTARQESLMSALGVEKVFIDKQSGKDRNRPELQNLMEYIREGDTVVVESISRMARSVVDLLNIVDELKNKKVEFVSQKENIDTSTPQGKFMLTVFAALAELERENILQRQREGIEIAKSQGKYKGRKPIEVDMEKFAEVYNDVLIKKCTNKYAMKVLNLKPNTYYKVVARYKQEKGITYNEE